MYSRTCLAFELHNLLYPVNSPLLSPAARVSTWFYTHMHARRGPQAGGQAASRSSVITKRAPDEAPAAARRGRPALKDQAGRPRATGRQWQAGWRLLGGLDDVAVAGVGDGQHGDAEVLAAGGAEVDVVFGGGGGGTDFSWQSQWPELFSMAQEGVSRLHARIQVQMQAKCTSGTRPRSVLTGAARAALHPPNAPRAPTRATHCRCSGAPPSWTAWRSTRSQTCAPGGSCCSR
jgi:hypothetical protein